MNELRAMQEFLARKNRESGMPGSESDMTDNEGFAPPAPAPPPIPARDPEVVQPKRSPAFQSVDLVANVVHTTQGTFPLNTQEVRQISAAAVSAMQRSFESILQTLVNQAGLNDAPQETGTDTSANNPPETVEGSAKRTRKSSAASTTP